MGTGCLCKNAHSAARGDVWMRRDRRPSTVTVIRFRVRLGLGSSGRRSSLRLSMSLQAF